MRSCYSELFHLTRPFYEETTNALIFTPTIVSAQGLTTERVFQSNSQHASQDTPEYPKPPPRQRSRGRVDPPQLK